jgi:hypothetical protein
MNKFGKAKYGAGKKTYFKLKEGESVFGILPPVGKEGDRALEDGIWQVYYRIVYGYKNPAGKSRPFESSLVKNRKNQMVEVPDASVERYDQLKAALKTAQEKKDKKGLEALHKLVGTKNSLYNIDSNHHINAVDLQGNPGILKLRNTPFKLLYALIQKLRAKGIDPLDPSAGRYFVFGRTGSGRETSFTVSVYEKEIESADAGTVKKEVVMKLSDEVIEKVRTEAANLLTLYKKPTAEQIEQIVKESKLSTGISPNIDEILGYSTDSSEESGEGDETEAEPTSDEVAEYTETAAESAESESSEATSDESESSDVAQDEPAEVAAKPAPAAKATATAKKVEAPAEKAKAPAPAAKKTATAKTTAETVADMSDDEFLNSLGISK